MSERMQNRTHTGLSMAQATLNSTSIAKWIVFLLRSFDGVHYPTIMDVLCSLIVLRCSYFYVINI